MKGENLRWSYEWARTFAIVVKVPYQVPSIQNEAPYQRRCRRRATRWRINRRSREGRNEVPAVNQSPTRSMGLQEVWIRTESTRSMDQRDQSMIDGQGVVSHQRDRRRGCSGEDPTPVACRSSALLVAYRRSPSCAGLPQQPAM